MTKAMTPTPTMTTPGPWHLQPTGSPGSFKLRESIGGPCIMVVRTSFDLQDGDGRLADVRLVAEAATMRSILAVLTSPDASSNEFCDAMNEARYVLAKIEGE